VRTAEDALTVLRQASQPLGSMGAVWLAQQGGGWTRREARRHCPARALGSRGCSGGGSIGGMSPPAEDGALITTFPRAWTADQRLAFMADVARAGPRERWAHVGEGMSTDSIDATAPERRAAFARPAGWIRRPCLCSLWTGCAALADEAMFKREARDTQPFLAACETCGSWRPWPTHAQAVADAGRHQQANLGHRTRVQNQNAILNGEGILKGILRLVTLIIVLALFLLTVAPRLYRFFTSS
jgi:hypothetical protein